MQDAEQLVVPVPSVDVEEHGARRVGLIGHVDLAFGQFPDQPGIDGTKSQFAGSAFSRAPGTLSRIQRTLVPEK